MPQLDRFTYLLQYFWVVVFLVVFYFFISFILLPLTLRNIIVRLELIKKVSGYFLYSKYLNFGNKLVYLIKNDNFFFQLYNVQQGLVYLYKQLFFWKKKIVLVLLF